MSFFFGHRWCPDWTDILLANLWLNSLSMNNIWFWVIPVVQIVTQFLSLFELVYYSCTSSVSVYKWKVLFLFIATAEDSIWHKNKISFILLFTCIRKKTNEICDISYLLHNKASENKTFWLPTRSNTNWPLQPRKPLEAGNFGFMKKMAMIVLHYDV